MTLRLSPNVTKTGLRMGRKHAQQQPVADTILFEQYRVPTSKPKIKTKVVTSMIYLCGMAVSAALAVAAFCAPIDDLENYLGSGIDMEVVDDTGQGDEFSYKMAVHTKIKGLEERIEELKKTNDELREKLKKLDYYELELMKARDEKARLQNDILSFQMIILKARIGEGDHPVTYEVKDGDSLWRIAGRKEIYDNPYKWIEIYETNKEKIEDPDLVYPGQVLIIPRY